MEIEAKKILYLPGPSSILGDECEGIERWWEWGEKLCLCRYLPLCRHLPEVLGR